MRSVGSVGSARRQVDLLLTQAEFPTSYAYSTFFAMFARAHVSSVEIPASELKIGSELQRGGMGAVLTGKWLGISVAVKTVTDVSKQEALLREAELLASMRHPCICQFYGASRIDGTFVMVMELLDCSLHEVIACPRSIPSALCLRLAHETAQGIAYLHRNNMLHR